MNCTLKIVVVDDHTMFRKGLCSLISLFPGCEILFDVANGKEFIASITNSTVPDIVLLDIIMPEMNGYDTAEWIKNNYPDIKIIALSTMDADTAIIKMIRSGARGYVLKDANPEELKLAFSDVMALGFFYNNTISRQVLKSINLLVDEQSSLSSFVKMNKRELEFIQFACKEMSYHEIAKEMFVSERTIDGYRDSLFKKLNVGSRVGLVLYAIRNGIVKL